MRITRLYLVITVGVLVGLSYIGFDHYKKAQVKQAEAERMSLLQQHGQDAEVDDAAAEAQYQAAQEANLRARPDAEDSLAIADEMLGTARADGKDVSLASLTIEQARDAYAREEYQQAWSLARQAIEEVQQAPRIEAVRRGEYTPSGGDTVYYTVQRGDTLWHIARLNRHYGLGSKWYDIWKANEGTIPDFDLIHPGQEILIPR